MTILRATAGGWAAFIFERDWEEQWLVQARLLAANRSTEVIGRQMLAMVDEFRQVARLQAESARLGSVDGTKEPPDSTERASSGMSSFHRLTTGEVAERLGWSSSYVTRLCRNRELSATLVSRTWWIDEVAVVAIEQSRRRK